nr:heparinase II/III family protein [Phytoactinopolyspora alkaliphila]
MEDLLTSWFDGPPRAGIGVDRGSVRFGDVGVMVLRDPQDTWQAVIDAGPHGGSHGHLDKLALYLYGDGEAWQPAPGVPPYASGFRRGYYARTVAHPTVRVDGEDQRPCTGEVLSWETGDVTRAVVRSGQAFPGVSMVREVVMHGDYLLDIVRVSTSSGDERVVTLGFRPGHGLHVTAGDDGRWRSRWDADGRPLHGIHLASSPSALEIGPGRGPSDDPAAVLTTGDWTATASDIAMVSVLWPDGPREVSEVELTTSTGSATVGDPAATRHSADGESTRRAGAGRVRLTLDDGRTDEYLWEDV